MSMRPEFEAMRLASQYYISPKMRAEAKRLREESERTGKSIHELEGGTPATKEDIEALEFGSHFMFPEVQGG